MAVLCPSCDRAPDGGKVGDPCPACGTHMVNVLSADRPDPLVGTVLDGRFEILARLGEGGMGAVYRARQRSIDREVAIKVIDRAFERDANAVKRFFREAKLASQLAHPCTVSIIEFGQDPGGQIYLAMELVRGATLTDTVRADGPLPLARVARIGVQLCDALEAAHALGIIHRDLKPDNVMVLDGGRDLIKVLDFGLARSTLDPASRMTATGLIAGTPRYLAPEVGLHDAAPAPAQDVYALGVLLGEIATGHELWTAENVEAMFAKKVFAPPILTGGDPALAPLVTDMLEPTVAERPTIAQVRARLVALGGAAAEPVITSATTETTPAPTVGGADAAAALVDARASQLVAIDEVDRTEVTNNPAPAFELDPGIRRPSTYSTAERGALSAAHTEPLVSASSIGLVALDPPPPPPAPRAPPAPPAVLFSGEPTPVPLDVEPEWAAARAAKQAAAAAPPPAPPRRSAGVPIAVGLAILVAGGGAAWWWTHRHPAALPSAGVGSSGAPGVAPSGPPEAVGVPAQAGAAGTVRVRVTAPAPVEIKIDGARAGKTPLTLSYTRGGPPVMITAEIDGRAVAHQLIPDRDQTIDLGE